jgi:hypothetical protein
MNRGKGKHHKPCQLGGQNAAGWCYLHRITVTPKQMRHRGCLQKHCRHLVPWKQHPIWEKRAQVKQLRQERKEREKEVTG